MGKHMSLADNLGDRPNTRLNGDKLSRVGAGVMLLAKEISVSRLDHSGADLRVERVLSSEVRTLFGIRRDHSFWDGKGSCEFV